MLHSLHDLDMEEVSIPLVGFLLERNRLNGAYIRLVFSFPKLTIEASKYHFGFPLGVTRNSAPPLETDSSTAVTSIGKTTQLITPDSSMGVHEGDVTEI